ncbi:MAG: serine hydrolase domain-containing protein [Vicinamibacterales bacterium]
MKTTKLVLGLALIIIAVCIGANGVYIGATDDAPGASAAGILLTIAGVALGVKIARNRLPVWAVRSAFVVAVVVAALAGFLAYETAGRVPLHAQADRVPSVSGAGVPPRWSVAVNQARSRVREHLREQNLPGLSVAVGIGRDVVWAEGFGWSDVEAQVPVTPTTRFRIGTASAMLTAAAAGLLLDEDRLSLDEQIQTYVPEFPKGQSTVTLRQLMGPVTGTDADALDDSPLSRQRCARPADAVPLFANNASPYGWVLVSAAIEGAADQPFLGFMRDRVFEPLAMANTGAESTTEENPEAIGEPAEDPPPFTLIRRLVFEPIGLGKTTPRTAMDIATVYVPRDSTDPRGGRRTMRLGNLSCYAGAMAFYSTPSDLVRFGLAINSGTLLQPATVQEFPASARLTSGQSHEGTLLGGTVASVLDVPASGIVVAVVSNTSHTDTSAIARSVAESFGTSAGR